MIFSLSLSWNEKSGNLSQNTVVVKMISLTVFPEDVLEIEQSCSEECFVTFELEYLLIF